MSKVFSNLGGDVVRRAAIEQALPQIPVIRIARELNPRLGRIAGGWPERNASSLVEPVGIPDLLGNSNIELLSSLNVGLSELLVPGKWQSGLL